VEYKQESFAMFESLLSRIDSLVARRIFRIQAVPQAVQPRQTVTESSAKTEGKKKVTQITKKAELGRNDPCWCGSGKKWKKCHYPQTS
jgi:preprotein translocase subunit SecA